MGDLCTPTLHCPAEQKHTSPSPGQGKQLLALCMCVTAVFCAPCRLSRAGDVKYQLCRAQLQMACTSVHRCSWVFMHIQCLSPFYSCLFFLLGPSLSPLPYLSPYSRRLKESLCVRSTRLSLNPCHTTSPRTGKEMELKDPEGLHNQMSV